MFAFLKAPGFWVLSYVVIANLIGFALMGIDKHRAKIHGWRIPEKVLFLWALLGGALGSTAGMYLFRHKTKHWYFRIGMPTLLLLQIALVLLIAFWPNGPR